MLEGLVTHEEIDVLGRARVAIRTNRQPTDDNVPDVGR